MSNSPSDKAFVFVVCGADEHIHTLNFAMKALKKFSRVPIKVVTDLSRNIEHDEVVNIETPAAFDNHQASIYLKTGLHRFLDMEKRYCYLDTDVIALDSKVDEIFEHQTSVITFAPDHCHIRCFSPTAVKCGCTTANEEQKAKFTSADEAINPNSRIKDPHLKKLSLELVQDLAARKRDKLGYLKIMLRYFTSGRYFQFDEKYHYDKREKAWKESGGAVVLYNVDGYHRKMKKAGFAYQPNGSWLDEQGRDIFILECDHLTEAIEAKFNVAVMEKDWHHWNGGVFLFDKRSVPFLDTWHHWTMDIFADPYWKTRDQGTLAATAWKFGMQNEPRLPNIFNFIADYNNEQIRYKDGMGFTEDNFRSILKPHFIHIYHHFGDEGWEVWRHTEKVVES
jgi:hypothetical protein